MPLPNTFAAQTSPQMVELDQNFAALGALTTIPCTVAGTNTLALTATANTPTIAAYSNYQPFSFIAANTNSTAATAAVGSLAALSIYKDSLGGPVVLTGGEIVAGGLVILTYDSALNTGAGGFHLSPPTLSPTLAAPVLLTSSSANYTVPAGVTLLRIAMTGAGGGGGGVSAAAATASAGLPGVMITGAMIVTPGQVIPYGCGAGGTRGPNTGTSGGVGGDTTFGPFTAKGGGPGGGSTSGNAAAQGQAGSTTIGQQLAMITGSVLVPTTAAFLTSQSGTNINGAAGAAGVGGLGRGIWGTGGTPGTNGSATDATGYGAGASGAGSTASTAGTGGLGAPGAILLY